MQSNTKMFTVDRFLGINEEADESTELPMGAASKMENFLVTDEYNLTLRPGIRRVSLADRRPAPILASWSGYVGEIEYFIICDFVENQDRLSLYQVEGDSFRLAHTQLGALGLTTTEDHCVKVFAFSENLFVMSKGNTVCYKGGSFAPADIYVPLVVAGASPSGGGTVLENINMLSAQRRVDYSADGTSVAYVLPMEAKTVVKILVDNVPKEPASSGSWDASKHTYTFSSAPQKGVGNVEFTYSADQEEAEDSRMRIVRCTMAETYNGSTDTRLFVAGDGTNRCYYTGVPQDGDLSKLYFPMMNDVAVDMTDSPITGMVRDHSKLLVFKTDSTYAISYEPTTLADGKMVAGFYLRNVSKMIGNEAVGQIQTADNKVRSLSHGAIYEWKFASYYRDERNAETVSNMVRQTLAKADLSMAVACTNTFTKTYYVFLNDENGTVLVNRYELNGEVWCIYRSPLFCGVKQATVCNGHLIFTNGTEAFTLVMGENVDTGLAPDAPNVQIKAIWESGFHHFGADFRRKYSSLVYVSLKPTGLSDLVITASTDRREEYREKVISRNIFSWNNVTFPDWTFNLTDTPRINRVRLKVKKFVYYKMIFKIERYGATATILGYDQQVRFSSMAK